METTAPTKFGKYDVVGVLGKGAMGTVYDCRDPVIGRRVAIKTVSKETFDQSESEALLGRFKQEAQAAGRLNHPGVVSIYDYGETDDAAFIAMEYISGKELKHYFDAGEKFDLKQIVRIMCEILDALDHAHRNKVVHRDIKPANIMITGDGRIKVADFGVAKIESSMMTQVGTRVGTPAYMSPEQHKMLSVDGRSDLFSCGVILYQFLTGTRPFTGGSHTIAQQILTQTPIPPSTVNVALPTIWDSIVRKALAKRRDERFSTARDFIEALQHGLNASPSTIDGLATSFSEGPHDTSSRASRESNVDVSRSGTASSSGKNERTDLQMESELEFWKEIKDSDIAEDFAAFIDSFPVGRFSHLAKRRLDKLRQAADRLGQEETALPLARTPRAEPIDHEAEAQARRVSQDSADREAKQRQREQAEAQARRAAEERIERESKERAERESKERAEREAKERAEREAKERAEREAKERAEREAKERAEREAKERARKEAEERKQQAQLLEATRAAAEKALKQQQEKIKRDAEQQSRSNAQSKRDAGTPADPDATEIRPGAGKKVPVMPAAIDDPDATLIRAEATEIRPGAGKKVPVMPAAIDDPDATLIRAEATEIRPGAGKKVPVMPAAFDDPDATLIRAEATEIRPDAGKKVPGIPAPIDDPDATLIRAEATTIGDVNAKLSQHRGGQAKPVSVDIDLSEAAPGTARETGSTALVASAGRTTAYPAPARVLAKSATAPVTEKITTPTVKSRSVPVVAGVAVALAVAGAGWVYLKSGPTPSLDDAVKTATKTHTAPPQESIPAPQPHKDAEPKVPSEQNTPDASKMSEAAIAAQAEDLRKLETEAKNRAAEKAAADTAAAKALKDKAAAEKLAMQKATADKAVVDKSAADKAAAAKTVADKAVADRAAADRAVADKAVADRAAADRAVADRAAADRAVADKAVSDKAAADRIASAGSIADRIAAASSPAELYKRAVALRNDGKTSQAVPILRQASAQGHGPSSRLLVTIFTEGATDVRANFREVERYKGIAETQGER